MKMKMKNEEEKINFFPIYAITVIFSENFFES